VASLVTGVHSAFEERVTGWVNELKGAIGAPSGNGAGKQTPNLPIRAD